MPANRMQKILADDARTNPSSNGSLHAFLVSPRFSHTGIPFMNSIAQTAAAISCRGARSARPSTSNAGLLLIPPTPGRFVECIRN